MTLRKKTIHCHIFQKMLNGNDTTGSPSHGHQFFQYFVIGRTEIVIGYFPCCNPTYVVVFQFLRLTFGNGTAEQCQMHCNVRVIMHNFHEHVADIYCNTQFLPTFTYKGLLPAFSRFHLAAYKFPQQCSCLVVRSLAG